ncbi:Seven TM Receptor [Caenorhabditis elegans]|uniref:Seven TM Receptor n=1 Tax=Caenorhabditis elegans TaxID=6239 RepID=Q7YTJ5_CAEEL|nr:Seven TM Receptor [Caenorhabditis elegans]CAE17970.2 Seven TM Receptor [Caenorhabditis elegans]|eukprot:NP_001024207.2 Uncharacterized protein CELE_W08G11.5 [Caenorhabditis elegans]
MTRILEPTFQEFCAIVSSLTNSVLIFLILTKSPPQLGSYKWLMLCTCFFELAYASLDIFVEPKIRTFQSSLFLVQDLRKSRIGHDTTLLFLLAYNSCYGSSMSIFACHFIYRYGAINAEFKQKHLFGVKQTLLYIAPIFTGFVWAILCWSTLGESSSKSDFLRPHFQQVFNMTIKECVYVAFHFWPTDDQGEPHLDFMSFACVVMMLLILGTSFGNVLYFGVKCYQYISNQLGSLSLQSNATKTLQAQIFYSLIIQSAIPCFLMYMPATIMSMIPLLNLGYDFNFPLLQSPLRSTRRLIHFQRFL